MKKGRIFSVLITIVLITISSTGCFGGDDNGIDVGTDEEDIPKATKDDIKVTLENYYNNTESNQTIISAIIENIRDYTIHVEGGFGTTLIIENIINSTDKCGKYGWTESHTGIDWIAHYQSKLNLTFRFSENQSSKMINYDIQLQFNFRDPGRDPIYKIGGKEGNDKTVIYSNVLRFNTTRQVIGCNLYLIDEE